ncbi:MAG: HupE/UreJ family protein [Leptothrix sp. (in: b-proteobacteria)]
MLSIKHASLPAKLLGVLALSGLATAAQAHTGHGVTGFMAGLAHPFGPDHLLAMVAVGLWSVFALPAGRTWLGPLTFMVALMVSAALGASGMTLPYLENAISASVVLFGLMLMLATRQWPTVLGLGLIAAASSLHGLAHGAEAPESASFANYAAGFLLTTAVLHFGGVFSGLALRRWLAEHATKVLAGLGVAFSGAGVYLLSQL